MFVFWFHYTEISRDGVFVLFESRGEKSPPKKIETKKKCCYCFFHSFSPSLFLCLSLSVPLSLTSNLYKILASCHVQRSITLSAKRGRPCLSNLQLLFFWPTSKNLSTVKIFSISFFLWSIYHHLIYVLSWLQTLWCLSERQNRFTWIHWVHIILFI